MAVINVRIDDYDRDQARVEADRMGLTLSEFVRDLVKAAVAPVRSVKHSDEPTPESMSFVDRQKLALLHRILARLLPPDGSDVDGDPEHQRMLARILEEGFTGAYRYEAAGFSAELSKRDCDRVSEVLELFRIITFSIDHLAQGETPIDDRLARRLEFEGFDHNDALEGHMASYVAFLMRDNRYAELQPHVIRHDNGNSHHPTLDTYERMLAEYRRIMDNRDRGRGGYHLTFEELGQIADAQIHPTNRAHFRSVRRYEGEQALISMPSDAGIPAGRLYEIRDMDRLTVLAVDVTGKELLDARRDQLAEYLTEGPSRTNIAMVDVAALIRAHAVP